MQVKDAAFCPNERVIELRERGEHAFHQLSSGRVVDRLGCGAKGDCDSTAHAIHSVVRHARKAREANERTVILFNRSGHGQFDLAAYDALLAGRMVASV